MSKKLELALRIRADMKQAMQQLDQLENELSDAGEQAKRTSSDMEKIGASLGKVAAALAGGVVYKAVIAATVEQERVTKQLEATLKATGGAAGLNRDQLLSMASALQQVTTYGDEAIIPAQSLLLSFKQIGGDIFPRALEMTLDLSTALRQDLSASATMLGKALEDPVRGVNALNRVGAKLTEEQGNMVKALAESGRMAEAQTLILEVLEGQYGGSARTARDSFGGAIQGLKNAFGDLLEGKSGLKESSQEIERLTSILADPATAQGADKLVSTLIRLTGALASAAAEGGNFLLFLDRLGTDISDKETEALKTRLDDLQNLLDDKSLFNVGERIRFFGPDGIVSWVSEDEIRAEVARIKRVLADAAEQGPNTELPTGGVVVPAQDPVLNAEAQKLLDTLKKQAETIGLITEEAKTRYAIDSGELGDLIPEHQELLLTQARQLDQAKANATASDAQRKATEKLASAQLSFVTNLERQASLIGLNTTKTREAEIAEKGLTGALLERAQAAAALLAAEEKRQIVAADAVTVAGLQVQLLRAQGKESDALALEMEQRFGALIKSLNEHSEGVGVDIVNELINVEAARTQLDEFEREIDEVLAHQQRGEQSINVQQDAGLLSEVAAREQLLELHRATADELERIRPMLDDMASMPGAIGEAATAVLAEIDNQMIRLQSTTSLLVETLRGGLEDGLANALTGLATGTMDLRSAIQSLAQTVIQAMAQMAANQLANAAMSALFSSFGGGLGGAGAAGSLVKVGKMRAAGGQVLGPGTGTSDSIATWLSNEEFVTRAAVVNQPGMLPLLEDINARGWAALHDHFAVGQATGGLAGVPAPAMPSPVMNAGQLAETGRAEGTQLQNNVDVFVGVPEQFIVNGAWSRQGREKFYGVLQEDKATIRQLLEL